MQWKPGIKQGERAVLREVICRPSLAETRLGNRYEQGQS